MSDQRLVLTPPGPVPAAGMMRVAAPAVNGSSASEVIPTMRFNIIFSLCVRFVAR